MKGYFDLFAFISPCTCAPIVDDPVLDEDTEVIDSPAKMLGSAIADGRYNGFSDGEAGLLHGMYDNDSSLAVDPLCDFSTDLRTLKPTSTIPSNDSNESSSQA